MESPTPSTSAGVPPPSAYASTSGVSIPQEYFNVPGPLYGGSDANQVRFVVCVFVLCCVYFVYVLFSVFVFELFTCLLV